MILPPPYTFALIPLVTLHQLQHMSKFQQQAEPGSEDRTPSYIPKRSQMCHLHYRNKVPSTNRRLPVHPTKQAYPGQLNSALAMNPHQRRVTHTGTELELIQAARR